MAVPAGLWCENCNRLVEDEELAASVQGTARCPHCDEPLGAEVGADPDAPPRAPWHFKVLLVGTVGYLVYRFIWFIFWIKQHA